MNMSDMPSDMHSGMPMDEMDDSPMVMTFFFSSSTSLFSKAWTPSTPAAYFGTCLFLLALAVLMRGMLALKPVLEKSMWNPNIKSNGILVPDDETTHHKEMGVQQSAKHVFSTVWKRWTMWRFKTSLGRATFELFLATVGYLLMLAVMTMNVGYFMSVLGGLFLGTFIVGDLAADNSLYQDHHC